MGSQNPQPRVTNPGFPGGNTGLCSGVSGFFYDLFTNELAQFLKAPASHFLNTSPIKLTSHKPTPHPEHRLHSQNVFGNQLPAFTTWKFKCIWKALRRPAVKKCSMPPLAQRLQQNPVCAEHLSGWITFGKCMSRHFRNSRPYPLPQIPLRSQIPEKQHFLVWCYFPFIHIFSHLKNILELY